MAGFYPDAPAPKMQYDLDGTSAFYSTSGGAPVVADGDRATWNDETSQNGNMVGLRQYVGLIFPELRDIIAYGFRQQMTNGVVHNVQTSTDTTNGIDGTWTTRETISGQAFSAGTPSFRTTYYGPGGIAAGAVPFNGVKAIRFVNTNMGNNNGNATPGDLHLYGNITSGQSLDRLRIWHPTLDQELTAAGFDFGDFGRGGTIDRTFRVKNNSSSLTASSIVLSTGALTDTSPTVLSQQSISQGGAFAATQNIGNLAPSAVSAVCTLRIASTGSTALGAWRQRLIATAGSWA